MLPPLFADYPKASITAVIKLEVAEYSESTNLSSKTEAIVDAWAAAMACELRINAASRNALSSLPRKSVECSRRDNNYARRLDSLE